MKNRSFEVLCHKQIRNARSMGYARFQPRLSSGSVFPAKDVRTGRPDTPSEGGGTWAVASCRNEVAGLARFSQ